MLFRSQFFHEGSVALRASANGRIVRGMQRVAVWLILIFAFFGLADSAYLAQHAASGAPLLCDVQNLTGCNVVAASPYSKLFGVPLAQYGVLFYSALFALAALEIALHALAVRRLIQTLSVLGVLASIYFTLLQHFVIGALCVYCIASAVITLFIFICANMIEPSRITSRLRAPSPRSGLPMPPII